MAVPPSDAWRNAFTALARQGDALDAQISPSERYYAFLSKADINENDGTWNVLFEVVTQQWMDNVVMSRRVSIRSLMPPGPALLFHIRSVAEDTLLSELGLRTADDLAEGSWYLLRLSKSGAEEPEGAVVGDLYDPDIDKQAS